MPLNTNKRYIVFLDLPKDIASKIDKVKSKYRHSPKRYPAHITLKQDEDFLINADEICGIVHDQIKNQKQFNVKLGKPQIMPNDWGWNIYLPVKSKGLNELVKKISKSLEKFIDPKGFHAFLSTKWEQSNNFYGHISIKGGDKEDDHKNLLAKIKKEKFGFTFPKNIVCDTITVANLKNNKWEKVKSFNLKNKNFKN
jgi:2'-5' RNA ligase